MRIILHIRTEFSVKNHFRKKNGKKGSWFIDFMIYDIVTERQVLNVIIVTIMIYLVTNVLVTYVMYNK